MSDGIHIPREVADAEGVPEDLDAGMVGPYRFPDPRRRRIPAAIYGLLAIALAAGAPRLPGMGVVAGLAAAMAAWHLLAAWPLRVEQEEALARSAQAVPFPVGHASAAVTFHGWRARPSWHVVLYSADEPPSRRALVRIDGVSGERIGEVYGEDVPRS